ncbi:hypothetical protein GWK47_007612 [Chionoecetes opilio]|uniref:Uncharacterized protein n=1 Tax=Chionoecetes opilio TaxID=41210 RepID=A0A8J5CQ79_CHIOP|nr:hypothetical protein GWK47_007612 [Chionoecetes opilio]
MEVKSYSVKEPDQGGCVGDAADAASRTVTKYDDDFFSLSHTTDTDVFGDESVVRVCEGSGEILMTEDKDLAEILKDGKQLHVGFQSCQPLATFYSVFSAVLTQQTGHYLLHHDPKTEAFIQLMKAADPDKDM